MELAMLLLVLAEYLFISVLTTSGAYYSSSTVVSMIYSCHFQDYETLYD